MPELPDFESIMQMAQNAQAELQKAQDNLDKIEVEGVAGGGMVKIRATAKGRILGVYIDESLLQPSGKDDGRGPRCCGGQRRANKGRHGGRGRNAEDANPATAAAGVQAALQTVASSQVPSFGSKYKRVACAPRRPDCWRCGEGESDAAWGNAGLSAARHAADGSCRT